MKSAIEVLKNAIRDCDSCIHGYHISMSLNQKNDEHISMCKSSIKTQEEKKKQYAQAIKFLRYEHRR